MEYFSVKSRPGGRSPYEYRGGPRGGSRGSGPPFSEGMKQNLDKIEILTTTLLIFVILIFNTVTRISVDGVPVLFHKLISNSCQSIETL